MQEATNGYVSHIDISLPPTHPSFPSILRIIGGGGEEYQLRINKIENKTTMAAEVSGLAWIKLSGATLPQW